MGKVHVRKVTLQAFRAFQERQSTPTLPSTGLIGIRGKDVVTGVSSGSGKSTVPLAIAYAFGFCPFPATEQQNLFINTPMQVEIELDTPEGLAVLRRGKEFSLTINGKVTQGSAKAVEEEITRMVGLPTELLEALTYRQQQERGRFLGMTDTAKKSFLSTLLGAGELEDQIANSIKNSNLLQAEVMQLDKVIEALSTGIIDPIKPAELDVKLEFDALGGVKFQLDLMREQDQESQKAIANMKNELADALRSFKPEPFVRPETQIEALKVQRAECAERIAVAEAEERAERKRLSAEISFMDSQLMKINAYFDAIPASNQRIIRLKKDIESLEADICPKCKRPWESEQLAIELDEKRDALKKENAEVMKYDVNLHAKAVAEMGRTKATESLSNYIHLNLTKLETIIATIDMKIAGEQATASLATQMYEVQCKRAREDLVRPYEEQLHILAVRSEGIRREINDLHLELMTLTNKIDRATDAYELQLRQYEKDVSHVTSLRAKIDGHKQERAAKAQTATEEADYAALVRSYLGSLFDEVLAQISDETNELLKSVPNTPTTTVTFLSEGVTKQGVLRQEIRPIIIKNGKQVSLKSGISGGQLESVELAVDLSISKVIGQRTGVRPGFMIFDESFSAHCLPTKEACMEVLKRAAQDCLIIVIDHATELADYFDGFIDVESDRDVSRFKTIQ